MTKPKDVSAARLAHELKSIDLRPLEEARRRTDDLVRTMLNSPPDPFTPKARTKQKKRAK